MLGAACGGILLGSLGDRIGRARAMGVSIVFVAAWTVARGQSVVDPVRPTTPRFAWELRPNRLSILHAGRRLADYVFANPEILRPYFQNVRAPSGAQVTRTHSPGTGDAADHATMHPGVWLAFGDINGEDFSGATRPESSTSRSSRSRRSCRDGSSLRHGTVSSPGT
jgi:hypothetical protein